MDTGLAAAAEPSPGWVGGSDPRSPIGSEVDRSPDWLGVSAEDPPDHRLAWDTTDRVDQPLIAEVQPDQPGAAIVELVDPVDGRLRDRSRATTLRRTAF